MPCRTSRLLAHVGLPSPRLLLDGLAMALCSELSSRCSFLGFDGYQWLRDSSVIAGATLQSYVPVAGDVGHELSCTVTVTYPLLRTTTSATSAAVTVIAQSTGPAGATGAQGPAGAQGAAGQVGARGPAGEVELVTCTTAAKKIKGKVHKQTKCATRLVAGPVSFTTASTARATLSRHGVAYARGVATRSHDRTRLLLTPLRRLDAGVYTLTLVGRDGHAAASRLQITIA
jgi:hypothetical protein